MNVTEGKRCLPLELFSVGVFDIRNTTISHIPSSVVGEEKYSKSV